MIRRLLLAGLLLALPLPVGAHATPLVYAPEASSVLEEVPGSVRIEFSERVEPVASSIEVFGPDGAPAASGSARVDPADPRAFSVALRSAGTGAYVVSWSVVSADDGHHTTGAFAFGVGSGSLTLGGSGQFQIVHRSFAPEALSIALELLGFTLVGGALAMVWLLRRLPADRAARRRADMLAYAGALIAVLGAACWFSVVALSGDAGFLAEIRDSLGTAAGRSAAYRAALGPVIAAAWALLSGRSRAIAVVGLLVVAAVARARISHAAAQPVLSGLAVAVNAAHLLGKGLWIAAAVSFPVVVLPLLDRLRSRASLSLALAGLTRLTAIALAVGGLTGAVIVWLHLKDPSNLGATHWGMEFATLTLFALLLVVVRAYHVFALQPAAEGAKGPEGDETVRTASLTLWTEAIVCLGVLFHSSLLIITTPPLAHPDLWRQEVASREATLTLERHPAEERGLLLTLLRDAEPIVPSVLTVVATNVDAGVQALVLTAERRFDGGYAIPLSSLAPPGRWRVEVTASRANAYDAVGAFDLDTRSLAVPAGRSPWLTAFLVLSGLGSVAAGAWLWRRARARETAAAGVTAGPQPVRIRHQWVVLAFELVLLVALAGHGAHAVGAFADRCEANGHMWHESVPMREGRVTSPSTMLGCMLGSGRGQYHFADAREYADFTRPTDVAAVLKTDPRGIFPLEENILRFRWSTASGGEVLDLVPQHDRIAHVQIIAGDKTSFAHLHPDDPGQHGGGSGSYAVHYTFPKPGRYLVALDYSVRAHERAQQFTVDVVGDPMRPIPYEPSAVSSTGGLTATLRDADDLRVGAGWRTLRIAVASSGGAVTDLEPYLAAPLHAALVSEDLRQFAHLHGYLPQKPLEAFLDPRNPEIHRHEFVPPRFGPDIELPVRFAQPGT